MGSEFFQLFVKPVKERRNCLMVLFLVNTSNTRFVSDLTGLILMCVLMRTFNQLQKMPYFQVQISQGFVSFQSFQHFRRNSQLAVLFFFFKISEKDEFLTRRTWIPSVWSPVLLL